jgi:hypothetical protein
MYVHVIIYGGYLKAPTAPNVRVNVTCPYPELAFHFILLPVIGIRISSVTTTPVGLQLLDPVIEFQFFRFHKQSTRMTTRLMAVPVTVLSK